MGEYLCTCSATTDQFFPKKAQPEAIQLDKLHTFLGTVRSAKRLPTGWHTELFHMVSTTKWKSMNSRGCT